MSPRETVTQALLRLAPSFPASLSSQILSVVSESRVLLLKFPLDIPHVTGLTNLPSCPDLPLHMGEATQVHFTQDIRELHPFPLLCPNTEIHILDPVKRASCAAHSPHPPDSAVDSGLTHCKGPAPWGRTGRGKRSCSSSATKARGTSQATVAHHNY